MTRTSYFAVCCLLGLAAAAQDDQALTVDQADLAAQFAELESAAIRLAQRLEADDPARAELLRTTIEQSRGQGVTERMSALADLLRRGRFSDAATGQSEIAESLSRLLDGLMADPQEALAAQQAEQLREAIQRIDRLSAKQRSLRGAAESAAEAQQAIAEEAEQLSNDLEASGQPTEGAAQAANPQGAMPKASSAAKRAAKAMNQAAEKMGSGSSAGAQDDQHNAERALEEAREALEERLRQLREEERYRMLKRMSERFEAMKAEQESVLAGTLEGAGLPAASRQRQNAGKALAQREQALIGNAESAVRVLREADAATAFLEATLQVADDMRSAEARLGQAELGEPVQAIEAAIILALEDAGQCLEEAAEQARKSSDGDQGSSQSAGGQPPLLQKIAELRMIRTLQKRVLARTQAVQKQREEGASEATEASRVLQELAGRQRRLIEALNDLMADAP